MKMEFKILESFNFLEYYPEDLRDYWRKVKQEIIKLQIWN